MGHFCKVDISMQAKKERYVIFGKGSTYKMYKRQKILIWMLVELNTLENQLYRYSYVVHQNYWNLTIYDNFVVLKASSTQRMADAPDRSSIVHYDS